MRQRFPIHLFSLLMILDVGAFLLQKLASDHATTTGRNYLLAVALHPWIWLSLAIAPLQLVVWTRILAKADISLAFPLTSLSVPLTMLASVWLIGERPSWEVWVGAVLITAGAAILKPAQHESKTGVDAEVVSGT